MGVPAPDGHRPGPERRIGARQTIRPPHGTSPRVEPFFLGPPSGVRRLRDRSWCRGGSPIPKRMLAALPKSAKVDADPTFASTCLTTLQLLVNLKKAWSHPKEHFILILTDRLQAAQVAPEILRLFNELVDRLGEVRIARCHVEVQASKDVNTVFLPVLGKGDDFFEHHDAPVLGRCLSQRFGILATCRVHLSDLGCRLGDSLTAIYRLQSAIYTLFERRTQTPSPCSVSVDHVGRMLAQEEDVESLAFSLSRAVLRPIQAVKLVGQLPKRGPPRRWWRHRT
jgi:hypothetical protein